LSKSRTRISPPVLYSTPDIYRGSLRAIPTTTRPSTRMILRVECYLAGVQKEKANLSKCGQCQRVMDLRKAPARHQGGGGGGSGGGGGGGQGGGAKQDRVIWCSQCKKGLNAPSGTLTGHEVTCPICSYQVLSVFNPVTNKTHTVCPQCFNFPPDEQAGDDPIMAGQFRCFNCSDARCQVSPHHESFASIKYP